MTVVISVVDFCFLNATAAAPAFTFLTGKIDQMFHIHNDAHTHFTTQINNFIYVFYNAF